MSPSVKEYQVRVKGRVVDEKWWPRGTQNAPPQAPAQIDHRDFKKVRRLKEKYQ